MAACLHNRARKHYNMRSVLRGIFWNAHNVLCMGGAAGDGRTIHIYIHTINSRTHVPFMWVSLRLAPINLVRFLSFVERLSSFMMFSIYKKSIFSGTSEESGLLYYGIPISDCLV